MELMVPSMHTPLHRNGISLENASKQVIVANETPYAVSTMFMIARASSLAIECAL